MTESDIASFMAPKTGILHVPIRRSLDAGKQTPESKKAEQERAMQETKRVQQVPQIPPYASHALPPRPQHSE